MRDLREGDSLDRYSLTQLVARGGMASIWKAIDTVSGADVALKIPHLEYECDIGFFERFRREEQLGMRLNHPNIVKVLDPGEKSRVYLVMELVEGRPLRAMLDGTKPLATPLALDIACQVAEALAYLHTNGVVHRDIKPENVLVAADGRAKILDFGIALDRSMRRLTWAKLTQATGTPDYMSPEQIAGRRGDCRTDVYALGTVLYEMLTCHLPYDNGSRTALFGAKTNGEPRAPSCFVPGFDPALERVLLKDIAPSPKDRYPDASRLLAALKNPEAELSKEGDAGEERPRAAFAARRPIVVAMIAAALFGGLASLVWLSSRPSSASPPVRPAESVSSGSSERK